MAAPQSGPMTTRTKAARTLRSELPEELRHSLYQASDLVRRRRAELRKELFPTSLTGLDHLLGGGLPRGTLIELVGRGSCGRFAALLSALRAVTGAGEAAAFVDQGAQLDPQAAAEIGIDLARLLWLRPQNLGDSLAAAELLIHTGFPLVALDLGLPPVRGRAPLAAWLRLARNAASHGAVVLAGSPYRLSGYAAGVVVTGSLGRGDWSPAGASRLLNGLQARLNLARRIGHPDLGTAPLILTLPEAAFGNSEFSTAHPGSSAPSEIERERSKEHVAAI